MLIPFDFSEKMIQEIYRIDQLTFLEMPRNPELIYKRLWNNPYYRLFLWVENDIPCGYIALLLVSSLHYQAAWVDLLAVDPQFQNQGVAQRMIKESKKILKRELPDLEFMSALVRISNKASLGALKKLEFHPDGKGDFQLLFHSL